MGITKETPWEQGWWWAKHEDGRWLMAYIDEGQEEVTFLDADRLSRGERYALQEVFGIVAWYGPIVCPEEGQTIILSEEDYQLAENKGHVVGLTHFDFHYSRENGAGASITISGIYTRDEAARRMKPEIQDFSYSYAAGEWLAGRITTKQMRETFEELQRTVEE